MSDSKKERDENNSFFEFFLYDFIVLVDALEKTLMEIMNSIASESLGFRNVGLEESVLEPYSEIHYLNNAVLILVEIRGVKNLNNVEVNIGKNNILIVAYSDNIKYYKEILVPREISEKPRSINLRNGVLELCLAIKS